MTKAVTNSPMSKVTSIFGVPYVLPDYRDKRGKVSRFQAAVPVGNDQRAPLETVGHEIVFGLVLHRSLGLVVSKRRQQAAWTISEPTTGCRVIFGATRQEAIDALAELVAFYGGELAFREVLEIGIKESMDVNSSAVSAG